MRTQRRGRLRLLLATGSLVAAGTLITAASFTDSADVDVALDGSRNTFDIVAAGKADPSWLPTPADWDQANPRGLRIILTGDNSGYTMAPGSVLDLRIAAKNNSPRLSSLIGLRILDPLPRGAEKNPQTGTYLELFDQLVFTVSDGGKVLGRRAGEHLSHAIVVNKEPGDYVWSDGLALDADGYMPLKLPAP